MNRSIKFLTSLLAGVTLGLLFAPKKGSELRKELSKSDDKIGTIGKELLAAGKDASEEVQKFLNKKDIREFVESGKAKLTDLFLYAKEKGTDLSDRAKDELENMAARLGKKAKIVKKAIGKKTAVMKKSVAKNVKKLKESLQ